MTRVMLVFTLFLATAMAGLQVAGYRLGPGVDPGGGIPLTPLPGIVSNVSIVAISPGTVITLEGLPVTDAQVIASTLLGDVVDSSFSGNDGTFKLATPAGTPLMLEVVGTPVSDVPFTPGSTIVVVLP